MIFWRIDSPEYESDYDYTFINGSLEHPFGLPGVKCDACGQTWGATKILPFDCPDDLRKLKAFQDRWPISVEEHENIRQIIYTKLSIDNIKLEPGYEFQPAYLEVPSKPIADFLWSSIGSVVISERIKLFLQSLVPDEISCVKVNKLKIGNRKPKLPAPIPSTGVPADIIDEVKLLKTTSEIQNYYELIINGESKNPLDTKIISICPKCKREEIDSESRILLMSDSIWNGQSIFFLATTLYIIITDELKKQLEKINPTNVRFLDITNTIEK